MRTFPSDTKMALMGRAPSWARSLSWEVSSTRYFSRRFNWLRPTTCRRKVFPTYSNNLLLPGVDDTDSLVFAGGADQAPVAIPGRTVNDIRVHVLQGNHGLACAHVPDDDLVVATCRR